MPRHDVDWHASVSHHPTVTVALGKPTSDGKTELEMTTGEINDDVRSFWGRAYCHWLAGAVSSLTGWQPVTIGFPDEDNPKGWTSTHTAVRTPDGRVLDINGLHSDADTLAQSYRSDAYPVSLSSEEIPGTVVRTPQAEQHRGSSTWWADLAPGEDVAGFTSLALTYARLLLTEYGYGEHLLAGGTQPAVDPARDGWPPVPQPRTDTHRPNPNPAPTTPAPSGGTMFGIDDVRAAIAQVNEKVNGIAAIQAQASTDLEQATGMLHQIASTSSRQEPSEALGVLADLQRQQQEAAGRLQHVTQQLETYAASL